MRFFFLFAPIIFAACSSFEQRDQARTLQSKTIRALNAKTPEYAKCAKKHGIFEVFGQDRIRVEIMLAIGSRGQVDRFQIDNKDYPAKFVDCMFEVSETVDFPKLKPGESAQLTQPFIFKK